MPRFCFFFIITAVLATGNIAFAQVSLPIATNFKPAYQKHTRDTSGSPGKNYWQNTAVYAIHVNLDPVTDTLAGTVGITYQNNSPDTLHQVVFKLYPNLYQAQAMRNVQLLPQDLTTGVQINTFQVDSHGYDTKKIVTRGTNMYLKGFTILPGKSTRFDIQYSYRINKTSFVRTGQVDSGAYMIAYFFPRVAVYDDIDGWNEYPYAGKEEFYNDYSNFGVDITVPGSYQVWATGELKNPGAVYRPEIVKRIEKASYADSITDIITEADLKAQRVTLPGQTHTWHFEARNVTDFAFAASNHYVWKASGVMVDPATNRRSQADAVYNPLHNNYVPVVGYARKTVELISYKIPGVPFPYPHITIFDGLDAMEYPMMVNNLPFGGVEAAQFTAHEVYHSLFPFFVGTNETKYSFMDEGWATFAEFSFAPLIAPGTPDTYDLSGIDNSAGSDQDVPVMTLTPQLYGKARFSDKDLKPALGFRYVRQMLGDALFTKAMRYFIDQWKGKHPTPYDFFNCMNKGAGRNLNWFWQNWFFEKNIPDLAITKVERQGRYYEVTVYRNGEGMVPVHLTAYYNDGSTQTFTKSVDCWQTGARAVVLTIPGNKSLSRLKLGDAYDADADKTNNVWGAPSK